MNIIIKGRSTVRYFSSTGMVSYFCNYLLFMTMIKEQCFSHSLNYLRDILTYQRGVIIIKSGLDLELKVTIK